MAAAQVELYFKAKHDLKRLDPGRDRKAVLDALKVGLTAVPLSDNLDIKPLVGAAPWLRLRVGDYRILFRPLTQLELQELAESRAVRRAAQQGRAGELVRDVQRARPSAETGYLVARIVHRRDLERAIRVLPAPP